MIADSDRLISSIVKLVEQYASLVVGPNREIVLPVNEAFKFQFRIEGACRK
jgi:hypothetical protein